MKFKLHIVAIAFLFCACKSKETKETKNAHREPARIAYGDCASASTNFRSGPRPGPVSDPFEEERSVATEDTPEPKEAVPETPPTAPAEDAEEADGDDQMLDGREAAMRAAKEAGVLGELKPGGAFASLTGSADFSSGLDDQDILGGDEVAEMQGGWGYGLPGQGPGGGGTASGAVGLGKYGNIGAPDNGTGIGYGYGTAARRRQGPAPKVKIGNVETVGDLDKNIIRRYVRRKLPRIRHCYEKELLVVPTLAGTVVTKFTISPQGTVSDSTASGIDNKEIESCVAKAMDSIQFPKPKGGGTVKARYPFSFEPADEVAPPAASTVPKPAPAEPPYTAGEHNPLKSVEPAIQACLRTADADAYGVMAVEMDISKDGSIAKSSPLGRGDAKLHACIAEAAKPVRVKLKAAGTYRCPIAYGNMPLEKAPHVDVTEEAISYGGRTLASTREIMEDQGIGWKIQPLFDALKATNKESAIAAKKMPVSLSGPLIVRPLPATPMKALRRIVMNGYASESNLLLAAQEDGEWSLLREVALPVEPVPEGTGSAWGSRSIGRYGEIGLSGEPPQNISVLVTGNAIWVGSSDGARLLIKKEGDAHDLSSVTESLKEMREKPLFKARKDIELSAEDDVTYGNFVQIVKLAQDSGFSDWALMDPQSLTVRFKE